MRIDPALLRTDPVVLTEQELTLRIGTVVEICAKYSYWTRVSKPNLPPFYYNVYCYIDYGSELETRIGTATLRYNGDISFSSHL